MTDRSGLEGSRSTSIETVAGRVVEAMRDLVAQEFSPTVGHLTAILNGCLFAPSLLTFWFVNGVLDFSTALTIGAVASPAGLQIRLLAYLLLVPTFLATRLAIHLAHPTHRKQVLSGSCPNVRYLSLDWFSVGILATGLPLALRDAGPWILMNLIFLIGLFFLPKVVPRSRVGSVKISAIILGTVVFLYAKYGGFLPIVPPAKTVLGPVATFELADPTVEWLLELANSVLLGPIIVATFGVLMNHLLTRPELTDIPIVRHTLPRRDPDRVVLLSAGSGTVFYLLVVATMTGQLVIVPR